jgi:peptidoglycan/LPS O-acetylase OafA/YrhL
MTADAAKVEFSAPEASDAPKKRAVGQFRPDIEGLRAIAVGLVIAFHAFKIPFVGGFVGVDVFFVISGFLITSLLLREKTKTGRVSVLGFYARRARRILPASAIVVILTVIASYCFLGFITGNDVADAAKWTAVFAANIHFGLIGTDYLGSQMPPSPLQHMWSLGVEEQFYVVWPGLFLLLVVLVRGARHRQALAGTLVIIVAASFAWSIIQTQTNATWAYFSPLTRACELGLGALVAVLAPVIAKFTHKWTLEILAAVGVIGIISSALVLQSSVPFPGSLVAWPVVSTALVIAVGCSNPSTISGRILSARPMLWLGARSYSLYLWHWPLLTIAAQYELVELNVWQCTGLVLAAVVASDLTYRLAENPIRRSSFLAPRTGLSLALGAALIAVTIVVAQCLIANNGGSWNPFDSVGSSANVDDGSGFSYS